MSRIIKRYWPFLGIAFLSGVAVIVPLDEEQIAVLSCIGMSLYVIGILTLD